MSDEEPPTGSLPKIILFGDSLTQWSFGHLTRGFGLHLRKRFRGKAEVHNRGIAGWTSQMLRPVFDIDLKDSRKEGTPVLLLTIWLGANDAVLSPSPAHVPLPKYVANLRHFVDSALREPVFEHATIVIISPPPIDVTGTDLDEADYIPQLRGKSEDEKLKGLREITRSNIGHRTYLSKRLYARKAMEVAREYERLTTEDNANATPRVFGLDFWSFLTADELCERGWETSADQVDQMDAEQLPGCGMPMVGGFRDEVFTDGLHLDEKGYAVLIKELDKLIADKIPRLNDL